MPDQIQTEIKLILTELLNKLGLRYELEIIDESVQYRINIKLNHPNLLTDDSLSMLFSIQHILRKSIHNLYPEDRSHFLLDVNLIRKNKEENIINKIPELVEINTIKEGKSIVIINLNSYERLLLRNFYRDIKNVELLSVGTEKERKLLILPSSEFGSLGLNEALVIDSNKL